MRLGFSAADRVVNVYLIPVSEISCVSLFYSSSYFLLYLQMSFKIENKNKKEKGIPKE